MILDLAGVTAELYDITVDNHDGCTDTLVASFTVFIEREFEPGSAERAPPPPARPDTSREAPMPIWSARSPEARDRQGVFSVPKSLRLRLAREPAWASWVNRLIVRAIRRWQRRSAHGLGVRSEQTEAVSVVQVRSCTGYACNASAGCST